MLPSEVAVLVRAARGAPRLASPTPLRLTAALRPCAPHLPLWPRGAADADLWTLSLLSSLAAAAFPDVNLAWLYKELAHKLEEELGAWGPGRLMLLGWLGAAGGWPAASTD